MNMLSSFDVGPSQFGFSPGSSQMDGIVSSSEKQKKAQGSQSLRALTIKVLLKNANTDNDEVIIDGAPVSTVTIVGKITSLSESSAKLTLTVNDGSGSIEVLQFNNDEDSVAQRRKEDLRVNQYVRVYGGIRKGKSIVAYSLRAVTDFNEVTYHFTQCIFQSLHIAAGGLPTARSETAATPTTVSSSKIPLAQLKPEPSEKKASSSNRADDAVLEILHECRHIKEQGLSKAEIISMLVPKGFPHHAVQSAIDTLANDGRLYTTIDDDHFQVA